MHEARRHVVAQHPIFLGKPPVGLHGGAEQVIDEGEVGGVVAVDRFLLGAVMPVVEIGSHDKPLERGLREGRRQATLAWLNTAWKPTTTI